MKRLLSSLLLKQKWVAKLIIKIEVAKVKVTYIEDFEDFASE